MPSPGNKIPETIQESSPKVIITTDQIKMLSKHTKSYYPREACALLFGQYNNRNYQIIEIISVPNQMRTHYKFGISKSDKQEAIKIAHHPLIGIYHSHKGELKPSATDIKEIKKTQGFWLIGNQQQELNLHAFELKAYEYKNNRICNLKMEEQKP